MRKVVFAGVAAALAAAGAVPAAAQGRGTIVHDGPHPVPHVRLHRPDGRVVVTRERPMRDRFDTRDYRRDPVMGYDSYADAEFGAHDDYHYHDEHRRYGEHHGHGAHHGNAADHGHEDDDGHHADYGHDHEDHHEGRGGDMRYGDARDIPYDRNYPYDYPYGGQGGYTVTETITTTTTPTIIRQIEYVDRPAAVHSRSRYTQMRRVHRNVRRSTKGPRR